MSKGCASGIYKTVRSRLVNGLRRRSAHCGYNVTIYYWYFGESDVEDVELIMRGRLRASRPEEDDVQPEQKHLAEQAERFHQPSRRGWLPGMKCESDRERNDLSECFDDGSKIDAQIFRTRRSCDQIPAEAQEQKRQKATRAQPSGQLQRARSSTSGASHCRSSTGSPYTAVSLSAAKRRQRDEVDLDCTCRDCSLSIFRFAIGPAFATARNGIHRRRRMCHDDYCSPTYRRYALLCPFLAGSFQTKKKNETDAREQRRGTAAVFDKQILIFRRYPGVSQRKR